MSKNKLSPHDRYIKSVFTNPKVVREFFEVHLPEKVKEAIDLNAIEPQKDSFIDDKLKLKISDILFATKFNNEDGYIYCLLEHASSPDRLLPLRLVKYMSAIIDQHLKKTESNKLPIIFPMVLYTGQKPFPYSTDLFDLYGANKDLAREIMGRPYKLVDLSQASDEELEKYYWFGAAALLAKHIKDKDIMPAFKVAIELFRNIEIKEERQYSEDYIYVSLSYIFEAAEIKDEQEFIKAIRDGLLTIDEDKIMTLAEKWEQKGRQEGRQAGLQEGLNKGLQEGLNKGLQEGLNKGRHEEKIEIARSMLQKGLDNKVIMEVTGLTQAQISELLH